jgi:hypothetical protein
MNINSSLVQQSFDFIIYIILRQDEDDYMSRDNSRDYRYRNQSIRIILHSSTRLLPLQTGYCDTNPFL